MIRSCFRNLIFEALTLRLSKSQDSPALKITLSERFPCDKEASLKIKLALSNNSFAALFFLFYHHLISLHLFGIGEVKVHSNCHWQS